MKKCLLKALSLVLSAAILITAAYAYGEETAPDESLLSSPQYTSADQQTVSENIAKALENEYQSWKTSVTNGDCYAFSKWLQDAVFGNAPTKTITSFKSVSKLRIGDIVCVDTYNDYWVVAQIGINYVEMISGGSKYYFTERFTRDDIKKDFVKQYTRYTDDAVIYDDPRYEKFAIDLCYNGKDLENNPMSSLRDHFDGGPFVSLYAYLGEEGADAVLPDGVEVIESNAFHGLYYRHSPKSLVLPRSLKAIGERAFDGCNIENVYYEGSRSEWLSLRGKPENALYMEGSTMEFDYVRPFTPGDANDDGAIDAKDVLDMRKYLVSDIQESFDADAADVTADGTVDARDVIKLRRYLVDTGGVILGQP